MIEGLTAAAEKVFLESCGRPPRWVVAAPGRVNLIGEYTDYNDGYVLPLAIDRHVAIAADLMPADGALVRHILTTEMPEHKIPHIDGKNGVSRRQNRKPNHRIQVMRNRCLTIQ